MTKQNAMISWTKWCESLWSTGEPSWIGRDGQDHYYRDNVVIPALVESTVRFQSRPQTLVDLGSGDGYTTGLYLERSKQLQSSLDTIVLVDRSPAQLELSSIAMPKAKTVQGDLTANCWTLLVIDTPSPRIFLSIFVLQELPAIDQFLANLAMVMSPNDLALAVIVAPTYSESLRKRGSLEVVKLEGSEFGDWGWAGKYPISTPFGELFLPHFQRHLSTYRAAFERNSLRVVHRPLLRVPETQESYRVFSSTVYGREIVGKDSSVLFTLKRQER